MFVKAISRKGELEKTRKYHAARASKTGIPKPFTLWPTEKDFGEKCLDSKVLCSYMFRSWLDFIPDLVHSRAQFRLL